MDSLLNNQIIVTDPNIYNSMIELVESLSDPSLNQISRFYNGVCKLLDLYNR